MGPIRVVTLKLGLRQLARMTVIPSFKIGNRQYIDSLTSRVVGVEEQERNLNSADLTSLGLGQNLGHFGLGLATKKGVASTGL